MPATESWAAIDSPRIGTLSEVSEENVVSAPGRASPGPRSPYYHAALSGSTSTFKAPAGATLSSSSLSLTGSSSRPPAGPRSPSTAVRPAPSRSASDASSSGPNGRSTPAVRAPGTPRPESPAPTKEEKDGGKERERERPRERDREKEKGRERAGKSTRSAANAGPPQPRVRNTPHLPHAKDVELAPATLMYWSRAPVYGFLPQHGVRAHSVTLVDNVAWLFGGCDEKGCWRDIYLFNTETMQWSHPQMLGDIPPPCRAHTATLVDRRIVVFGGGEGPAYYNDVYVLDTVSRRWTHKVFPEDAPLPPPRRAHTAVLYKGKVWVFGGGNGMEALNDLWTLDCSGPTERMRWEQVETRGRKPMPRGYHTANLVGNVMVVVGGSDGRECFSDIWCLSLDTLWWSQPKLENSYRRLSHTSTQVGSYLFIMGGHDGSQYTSELLLFNLVALSFEPRTTAGKPPSPRGYHVSFLADSRMFIFGGFNGNEVFDDVHLLDLAGAAYLPQVTSFRIDV
ncbi:galactose oxidase [Daedalea quercina L-15889]|uniref:Galactose oxidase n=1 Tax=Daedalea quercina L-15889 TaxID=1314783 RepID=A0A165QH20_9APHY|nr:galactose oxidase [Daedalea quercina L-15889]